MRKILIFLLIFYTLPKIALPLVVEYDDIVCAGEDIFKTGIITGKAYCENDKFKIYTYMKDGKFDGYALQEWSSGSKMIQNFNNGSMNGIGFYQKDNYLDISEHKSRVRNGLSISVPDLKDFNTSYFRTFSNGDIDFDFPIKKISIDEKSDRQTQELFYLQEGNKFKKGSFYFSIEKSIKQQNHRVTWIGQINEDGYIDGYAVKVDMGIPTYGIVKDEIFTTIYDETEVAEIFPIEFWEFQSTLAQQNPIFLRYLADVNNFLDEANEFLSISIDISKGDFLSKKDERTIKKLFQAQIREFNNR